MSLILVIVSVFECIKFICYIMYLAKRTQIKDGEYVVYNYNGVELRGKINRSKWLGFTITVDGTPSPYYFELNDMPGVHSIERNHV